MTLTGPTAARSKRQNVLEVVLEPANETRERQFLAAVKRSCSLHEPWVYPPATRPAFRRYLERLSKGGYVGYFVCVNGSDLAGVININEIVMGAMCSGALGYYAFEPWAGSGAMRLGLSLLLRRAFTRHGLHRLEANIQPKNVRSRALVLGQGFRFEGLATRLLKVGRDWKDHERWALTIEEWRARRSNA